MERRESEETRNYPRFRIFVNRSLQFEISRIVWQLCKPHTHAQQKLFTHTHTTIFLLFFHLFIVFSSFFPVSCFFCSMNRIMKSKERRQVQTCRDHKALQVCIVSPRPPALLRGETDWGEGENCVGSAIGFALAEANVLLWEPH